MLRLREMGKYFEECFNELDQEANQVLWKLLESWKPYNELNNLIIEENRELSIQNKVIEHELKVLKSFSSKKSHTTAKERKKDDQANFAPNILNLGQDSDEGENLTPMDRKMKQQREQLAKQLGL